MEKIKPALASGFFILLSLSLILSCFRPQIQKTQSTGVYHLVKKNETALMIADAYHVRLQTLAEMNNTTDLNSIKEGDALFIPDANKIIDDVAKNANTTAGIRTQKEIPSDVNAIAKSQNIKEENPMKETRIAAFKKEAPPDGQSPTKQRAKVSVHEKPAPAKTFSEENMSEGRLESKSIVKNNEKKIKIDKNRFIWPVRGSVKTSFGIQPNKTYHNWITFVSPAGTKVKAAASGIVIFSSLLKDYGETIIIRHKDNFATVYTHLKNRYVRADQNVKRGEAIAVVGEKDDAGEAYVNFEIRLQGKARNPITYLP